MERTIDHTRGRNNGKACKISQDLAGSPRISEGIPLWSNTSDDYMADKNSDPPYNDNK